MNNEIRDLKRVERDIAEAGLAKEKIYSDISNLNDEQRKLNDRITRV